MEQLLKAGTFLEKSHFGLSGEDLQQLPLSFLERDLFLAFGWGQMLQYQWLRLIEIGQHLFNDRNSLIWVITSFCNFQLSFERIRIGDRDQVVYFLAHVSITFGNSKLVISKTNLSEYIQNKQDGPQASTKQLFGANVSILELTAL